MSTTRTWTAGAIATPATTSEGCAVNDSAEAAAADTVNELVVAAASAPLDAVSCLLPARSTRRLPKLAMPLALLATAPPPVSVPVP